MISCEGLAESLEPRVSAMIDQITHQAGSIDSHAAIVQRKIDAAGGEKLALILQHLMSVAYLHIIREQREEIEDLKHKARTDYQEVKRDH